ncbi:TlpA family protein disulfide reductase [Pedobacter fastidiosus]
MLIQVTGYSQSLTFSIKGNVDNAKLFKYAYLFNNDYEIISKQEIKSNDFSFVGSYMPEQLTGEITIGLVLLSNTDTITRLPYSSEKIILREFILEPKIEITYKAKKSEFNVLGGEPNEIQTVFVNNETLFKNRKDSLFLAIDSLISNKQENFKQKNIARQENFYEARIARLELVKKYRYSKVGLFNFMPFAVMSIVPIEEAEQVFDSFPDSLKNSKYGTRLSEMLKDQKNAFKPKLNIGDIMPVFKLNDVSGNKVESRDLFNKYTLIDFWASWCRPCRAENPNLKLAYNKYHKKGFNIISISIDKEIDKDKWRKAIIKDGIQQFINLFNPFGSGNIAEKLNINTIPTNYLVESDGKVVGFNLRGEQLIKTLEKLMK